MVPPSIGITAPVMKLARSDREERCELGDLLGLTGALEGRALDHVREPRARALAAGHLGLDEARADGVGRTPAARTRSRRTW